MHYAIVLWYITPLDGSGVFVGVCVELTPGVGAVAHLLAALSSYASQLASFLLPPRNPNGKIGVLIVGGTNTSQPYSPLVGHPVLSRWR